MVSYTVRLATRADLPALEWDGEFAHFRRLFAETYQQVEAGEALIWIAELSPHGIIGQIFVQLNGYHPELADGNSRAYLYAFRVRPSFRKKGIGTCVLRMAEADLARRGYRQVAINVARDNEDARRLYERLGYCVVAAEAGEWSYLDQYGQRQYVSEPAWRMEKELLKNLANPTFPC